MAIKKLLNKFNWKRGIKVQNYTLDVRPGERVDDNSGPTPQHYYIMQDRVHYGVYLRNDNPWSCDCQLILDGKEQGTFRLGPHKGYTIYRPTSVSQRFTFIKEETVQNLPLDQATQTGVVLGHEKNGLVEAKFIPEAHAHSAYNDQNRRRKKRASGGGAYFSVPEDETVPLTDNPISSVVDDGDDDRDKDALSDGKPQPEPEKTGEGASKFMAGATTLSGFVNQGLWGANRMTLAHHAAVAITARLVAT